eukprot:CAMPEP_0117653214 /NCGR_PEP_ID=MMETSP0804-20121206/3066_1 /TAXON_ID=1074897 /ORGANISM="Tetraselmis astigmatica, Strain CCMP880" /LENGTH=260 /DNA_ID=CAMNT_0005459363 /DNA_START=96 /DNA_END=879 /DNA_ORIENTATION=+
MGLPIADDDSGAAAGNADEGQQDGPALRVVREANSGDSGDDSDPDEYRDAFAVMEEEWEDPSGGGVLIKIASFLPFVAVLLCFAAHLHVLPGMVATGLVFEAAEKGDSEQLSELLSRLDVSPNTQNEDGDSALHLACLYGKTECVRLLLASQADATATDEDNGTPLHDAAAGGYMEIVSLLLAAGAASCVNHQDNDGETPLHMASRAESVEVVAALLEHGADPAIENNAGRKPEDEARGCPDIQQALQEASQSAVPVSDE